MRRILVVCAVVCLTMTAAVAWGSTISKLAQGKRQPQVHHVTSGSQKKSRTHTKAQRRHTRQTSASPTTSAAVSSSTPYLLGNQQVEGLVDEDIAGMADAFPFTAHGTGEAQRISIYLDSQNQAKQLLVGLYSSNQGQPAARIASGSLASPKGGAWNAIPISTTSVISGRTYWITLLGKGGAVYFRDRSYGPCQSETSGRDGMTSLPSAWTVGTKWTTCPISAFATGVAAVTSTTTSTTPTTTTSASLTTPTTSTTTTTPTTTIPPLVPPLNLIAPAISGTSRYGQTLSAGNGTWTGSPTSYAYQWQDCNTSGTGCSGISGATDGSYTLRGGDIGHTLRVMVTAANAGGSTAAGSAATAVVAGGVPTASFTDSPASPVTGQAVHFDGGASVCPNAPCTYAWADQPPGGGNWSLGAGQAIDYTFSGTGTKYVTLTVTDAANNTASIEHDVLVGSAPASAPTNTAGPQVSGTATQGQTLSTSNGSWTGSPSSFAYKWEDCDTTGAGCAVISGATSSSYTLGAGDVGSTIRAIVTATNAGGSSSATSSQTGIVAAQTSAAPTNTAAPQISGTATQGQTLSTSNGVWTGTPGSFAYKWEDCDTTGAGCAVIGGATSSSYTLGAFDVGSTIRAIVTATNAGGSNSATSAQTTTVSSSGGGGTGSTCDLNATTANFASQISAASGGQTVCLASGTYGGWSPPSKSSPITITAASGATVKLPIGNGGSWSLSSMKNFVIDGTAGGGTITIPAAQYGWSGSTTSPLNVTIRNVVFAPNADLDISDPTNSNITLDHVSWDNSDCLSNEGIRLHLSYSNNTQSGVTVENSTFIGGSADGIQTGDPMTVINNVFKNIYEGSETQCHTDAIQLVGTHGVATVIKGNWIINAADGIGGWDGPLLADIENNVIDHTTENNAIDLDDDQGSTIVHNTIISPNNGVGIDLTSKSGQGPSHGTIVKDNVVTGASNPISTQGGGCNCTATTAANTNNMFSSGAGGSNFNGNPTFSGSSPYRNHNSYSLTSGSAGHGGASDGTDVGVYPIADPTFGPQ
jgi:hypothetical protein